MKRVVAGENGPSCPYCGGGPIRVRGGFETSPGKRECVTCGKRMKPISRIDRINAWPATQPGAPRAQEQPPPDRETPEPFRSPAAQPDRAPQHRNTTTPEERGAAARRFELRQKAGGIFLIVFLALVLIAVAENRLSGGGGGGGGGGDDPREAPTASASPTAGVEGSAPPPGGSEADWLVAAAGTTSGSSVTDVNISGSVLKVHTNIAIPGEAVNMCFELQSLGWTDDIEVWDSYEILSWTGASNTGCVAYYG